MSESVAALTVQEIETGEQISDSIDLLVLAAGFEERALHFITTNSFNQAARCILIRYENDTNGNDQVFEEYKRIANSKFGATNVSVISLASDQIKRFSDDLEVAFHSYPPELKKIAIDVSGMTSYTICLCLRYARKVRPFEKQRIIYTSAKDYVPSKAEYEDLLQRLSSEGQEKTEIDYLPKSMALEMSENLVLEDFQGHNSGNTRSCLAIFAGYEVHRSSGTIDAINPSLLLLMYGVPGGCDLEWRLNLSKSLHSKFENGRRCATEDVSTLEVQNSIDKLEEYYNYLIDDYDLVVAPICSKMHSVAAYLFWERYGEVQLTFPLPIGYDPENRPTGVDKTYFIDLYEQRMLFRSAQ